MLRAEHKRNYPVGATLCNAEEATFWLRCHNPTLYDFKVLAGYSWVSVYMPTNEIAQKFKLEQIFSGKIKKKRVKFLWKTESWKVMG